MVREAVAPRAPQPIIRRCAGRPNCAFSVLSHFLFHCMSPSQRNALDPRGLLRISIGVALVTIVLKGLAGFITNSMGLISDAMESFVNLASAMFALAMVTVAARPADEDHPYGHHKAEYFSSGFEGILI